MRFRPESQGRRVILRGCSREMPYDTYYAPVMDTPHIVIVGGGFGGLDAAQGLRSARARITLLDRHNYHLFQPLLYQVATAALSPGDIASPIRWVLRRQKNVQVLLADARAVEVAERRVVFDATTPINYDFLIIATGSAHAYFGHPE